MDNYKNTILENYAEKDFIDINYSEKEFKKFISDLLIKFTTLDSIFIDKFLTSKNLSVFQTVFIHFSFDFQKNQEVLEKIGDGVYEILVMNYINFLRFSSITNSAMFADLKSHLTNKPYFSRLANDLGFKKFFLVSENYVGKMQGSRDVTSNAIIKDMLEDTLEAFLGMIFYIFEINFSFDFAIKMSSEFVYKLFNKEVIEYGTETTNPLIRLNEIYPKLKWGFLNSFIKITQTHANRFDAILYGFAPGDDILTKKIVITEAYGKNSDEAKLNLARKALPIFYNTYKMKEKKINYFALESTTERLTSPFSDLDMKKFLGMILQKEGKVNKYYIDDFLNPICVLILKVILTRDFYTAKINFDKLLFFGGKVLDFMILYNSQKYVAVSSEGFLAKFGNYSVKIFEEAFEKYINNLDKSKYELKYLVLKFVYDNKLSQALFGAIYYLIYNFHNESIALSVCKNFYAKIFKNYNIIVSLDAIYDESTQLNQIYQQFGWKLSDYIKQFVLESKTYKTVITTPPIKIGGIFKPAIVTVFSDSKDEGKKRAMKIMIMTLTHKYKIKQNYNNVYESGKIRRYKKNLDKIKTEL